MILGSSETKSVNKWFLGIQKVIFEEDVEDKCIWTGRGSEFVPQIGSGGVEKHRICNQCD